MQTFDFKVNGTSKGNLTLTASGGIPDREFGDGVHDFLYLEVTSATGEVWLNNNLGADYTNVNHASFNHSTSNSTLRSFMLMVVSTNGVDTVMGTSLLTGPLLLRVLLLMGLHLLMQIHLGMVILLKNLTTLTIGVHHRAVLYGKERQLPTTHAQRVTKYHQKQS